MSQSCKTCNSCGMPLERPEDCAKGDLSSAFCVHCTHPDGKLKSYKEVHEGMTNYLIHSQGLDADAAKQMAENELKKYPAWKK